MKTRGKNVNECSGSQRTINLIFVSWNPFFFYHDRLSFSSHFFIRSNLEKSSSEKYPNFPNVITTNKPMRKHCYFQCFDVNAKLRVKKMKTAFLISQSLANEWIFFFKPNSLISPIIIMNRVTICKYLPLNGILQKIYDIKSFDKLRAADLAPDQNLHTCSCVTNSENVFFLLISSHSVNPVECWCQLSSAATSAPAQVINEFYE